MVISRNVLRGPALFLLAAVAPGLAAPAAAQPAASAAHVRGATALTRVFGEGQKLVGVAIEYDRPILARSLSPATYAVAGRKVVRVYPSASATRRAPVPAGRFVVVEMAADDAAASLAIPAAPPAPGGARFAPRQIFRPASAEVMQARPVRTAQGQTYAAPSAPIRTTAAHDPLVDLFSSFTFKDAKTGLSLRYNLFLPAGFDPRKRYPLVLFMHDAGVISDDPLTTLKQGLGAVAWASPEDQARHPAIVLAPQYDHEAINNGAQSAADLETTVDLVEDVTARYGVDPARRLVTGQSMGGTLLLDMAIRYPDLFAAGFVVASQTDPATVGPLAGQKLWIVVSEGDARAYPTVNEITARLEQAGTGVSRAVWSGRSTGQEFAAAAAAMKRQGNPVNYVALRKGTVVPVGTRDTPGSNHINTWRIAYAIPEIRDWLMRQHR